MKRGVWHAEFELSPGLVHDDKGRAGGEQLSMHPFSNPCVPTLDPSAITVKLHRPSFLTSPVCGLRLLKANTGRPALSAAYSTTEPEGNPSNSLESVESTPNLQHTKPGSTHEITATLSLRWGRECGRGHA